MDRRSEAGGVLVYVVVLVALAIAAMAVVVGVNQPSPSQGALATAAVAGLVAALVLVREARRDLDGALTFSAVCLLIVAIFGGIYLLSSDTRGPVAMAITGGTFLLAVALGAITLRRQRGPESPHFPNVLRRSFHDTRIFERDGVQFTGFLEAGADQAPHVVNVLVQNCFSARRTVRIRFDAGSQSKYLRYPETVVAELGPAEVAQVAVPVVSPTYEGKYSLFFDVAVTGKEGRRVRRWRAKTPDTRFKPGASAALLAVGVVAFGGGLKFTIGPLPSDIWARPLPEPEVKVLWRPQLGTLPD